MKVSVNCINYNSCPLINTAGFIENPKEKDFYIKSYCRAGKEKWSQCKRYLMKLKWHFCPDFVMPDTPKSTDELLDKFEEEN